MHPSWPMFSAREEVTFPADRRSSATTGELSGTGVQGNSIRDEIRFLFELFLELQEELAPAWSSNGPARDGDWVLGQVLARSSQYRLDRVQAPFEIHLEHLRVDQA